MSREHPEIRSVAVEIVGDSPLIVHRIDPATFGRPKPADETDEDVIRRTMHFDGSGSPAFPGIAVKNAIIAAARSGDDRQRLARLRLGFHVAGELVPLKGRVSVRRDTVTLAGGHSGVVCRSLVDPWSMPLTLRFDSADLGEEELLGLLGAAGRDLGVGEWRAERGGPFGRFHVVRPMVA